MDDELKKEFDHGEAIGRKHAKCKGNEVRRQKTDKLMREVARIVFRHVETCPDATEEDRAYAKELLDAIDVLEKMEGEWVD